MRDAARFTSASLANIAYGALFALEGGNAELAARLLADVLAEAAEAGAWDQSGKKAGN